MEQTLLYESGRIKVYREEYPGTRGTIYLITDGYYSFHTGEQPNPETLLELFESYLLERE